MKIGIDGSRAFVTQRTGIEEYSYQVIKHLIQQSSLNEHEIFLYVHQEAKIDFDLPSNCQVVKIPFGRFWTQIGLSLEILFNPIDVLFVPAHTVPFIHPKNTVVTVHGLEYEHCPESYSLYSRWFHRTFIKKSCRWANHIVAVSQKTKNDLIEMYGANKEKIEVVYNGFDSRPISESVDSEKTDKFLLFIGRLEKRKNIEGIIKAFKTLKEKYSYTGQLILAGKKGHGYKKPNTDGVIEKGFISEEEKWNLLRNADVFLFPSFCEGFGIPILEAQSVGTPVITSNFGPMDEVAGNREVLVDPKKPEQIAQVTNKILTNDDFKNEVIKKGRENVKRFSWEKCAKGITTQGILLGQ